MRYVILIYSPMTQWAHPGFTQLPAFESLPEERKSQLRGQLADLINEITGTGELIDAHALDEPGATKVVTVRDGATVVTAGSPQAMHLSGYFLVECGSEDRAIEIAGRFPDALFGKVEVRPTSPATAAATSRYSSLE